MNLSACLKKGLRFGFNFDAARGCCDGWMLRASYCSTGRPRRYRGNRDDQCRSALTIEASLQEPSSIPDRRARRCKLSSPSRPVELQLDAARRCTRCAQTADDGGWSYVQHGQKHRKPVCAIGLPTASCSCGSVEPDQGQRLRCCRQPSGQDRRHHPRLSCGQRAIRGARTWRVPGDRARAVRGTVACIDAGHRRRALHR